MQLTPSQQYTLTNLPKWYTGNQQVAVLQGQAGCGKTYLIKHFLDTLGKRVKPLLLAETNEAVNVLGKSLGGKYTCKTVCSALGLYLSSNGEKKELKQSKLLADIDTYNLIIVDEASMLDSFRLDKLQELETYILYVGHKSQLPPVIKDLPTYDKCISPVFERQYHTFNLKEPVRHKGKLWDFCNEAENLIYHRGILGSEYKENKDFINNYLNTLEGKGEVFAGNTVMLCYTNARVDLLNNLTRVNLFGNIAIEETFIIDDKIIFREPVAVFNWPVSNNCRTVTEVLKQSDTVFTVNTKGTVTKVNYRLVAGIGCYELSVTTDHYERGKEVGFIYVASDINEIEALKKKLYCTALYEHDVTKAQKKWAKYHELSLVYSNVRHAYARTIHTAQGSSILNVIADDYDIDKCTNATMKKKLRYVAYSRAVNNLYRI